MNIKNIVVIIFVLICNGCSIPRATATASMASQKLDAYAKRFNVRKEKAILYVYRDAFAGYYVWMPIIIDSRVIARTVPWSYICVELDPGEHQIISRSENDYSISACFDKGQVYFMQQSVLAGVLMPRCGLKIVNDDTGHIGVNKCKMLDYAAPFH